MTERIELTLAEDCHLGRAGQRVTVAGNYIQAALQPGDVHDPTEMPNYLAGYRPFDFRADEASPPVLVDKDQDKFRNFASDDTFRRVDVKTSIQGAIPEVDPSSSLSQYKVVERLLGAFIPTQTESQANANYRPRQVAAAKIARKVKLDRELDVWGFLATTGNWTANNVFALGGGFQWGNLTTTGQGVNSDPIFDLQNLIVQSAQYVSANWFNPKTAFAFLRHPNVRTHMRQLLGDGAVSDTLNQIRSAGTNGQSVDFVIPGLPPFKVCASKVKNETTGNLDYILPDGDLIAATVPPGVPQDGEEIATTYTFRRRGPSGVGFEAREFFLDARGSQGGTMVVCSMADIAVMTGSNCGGIITGVLQ
jgi:hypothetical protein